MAAPRLERAMSLAGEALHMLYTQRNEAPIIHGTPPEPHRAAPGAAHPLTRRGAPSRRSPAVQPSSSSTGARRRRS